MSHPGWRGESKRHADAARGIKSGRKPTKVGERYSLRDSGYVDKLLYFAPKVPHQPDDEAVVEVEWKDGKKETFFAISTSYGPEVAVRDKKGRKIGWDNRQEFLRVFDEETRASVRINMDEVKQVRMYSPAKYFKAAK